MGEEYHLHNSSGEEYHLLNSSGTNFTNHTRSGYDADAMMRWYYTLYIIIIVLGTTLNLWMLISILSSRTARARLRTKLICVLLVNNLLKALVVAGIQLFGLTVWDFGGRLHCSLVTFSRVVRVTVVWVENWYFLILLTVYVCALMRWDAGKRLSPRTKKLAEWVILIGPWVFSLIAAPSMTVYFSHDLYGRHPQGCLVYTRKARNVVNIFGIAVPFFFKILFLAAILAAWLWRRRQDRVMTSSLIGAAPQLDRPIAYVTACVVCLLTEAPAVTRYVFDFSLPSWASFYIYVHAVWFLMEIQVFLLPPCFLLLKDLWLRFIYCCRNKPTSSSSSLCCCNCCPEDPDSNITVRYSNKMNEE